MRRAVFLDRDGTLNVERSFILKPEEMDLLPGAAESVKLLKSAGFVCVVVTNQSAVGRGLMTEADLDRVHEELKRQLAQDGAVLDAVYACTAAPVSGEPLAIEHPDRKPAPGMLLRAAADLGLDLSQSWMIGDSLRDILAGQRAGCAGCVLVRTGHVYDPLQFAPASPFRMADDILAAVQAIIDSVGQVF